MCLAPLRLRVTRYWHGAGNAFQTTRQPKSTVRRVARCRRWANFRICGGADSRIRTDNLRFTKSAPLVRPCSPLSSTAQEVQPRTIHRFVLVHARPRALGSELG